MLDKMNFQLLQIILFEVYEKANSFYPMIDTKEISKSQQMKWLAY